MPTIQDLLQFLRECQLTEVTLDARDPRGAMQLTGVNTDQGARKGELAWLSPRVTKTSPERVASFRGSVLIHPSAATENSSHEDVVLIPSQRPKLAFIRAVTEFFPALGETTWPAPGAGRGVAAAAKANVHVAPGAVIGSGVTMGRGTRIGPNTALANTEIGRNVTIGANCTIGLPGFGYERDDQGRYWRFPHVGKVVIEDDVEIGSNTCIDRGAIGETRIGRGSKIDNLVHIAHNVVLAENSVVIANSMLGGSVRIGEGAWIAPSASIMNQADIGARAIVGLGAVVLKSVDADTTVVGNPAKPLVKKEKS